ncbi:MAG: lipase family protein [Treponemataceae bacterium]
MKKIGMLAVALFALILVGCPGIVENDFTKKGDDNTGFINKIRAHKVPKNYKILSSAPDVYVHSRLGYNGGKKGPITITKGVLEHKSGRKQKVYVVGLSGTEMKDAEGKDLNWQATGVNTDLASGTNKETWYAIAVCKAIYEDEGIPYGSSIILTGHSLGGMTAQQVAASSVIHANYDLVATLTFGSPPVVSDRQAILPKRFADVSDLVPKSSQEYILGTSGENRSIDINGGYGSDKLKAHSESYLRKDLLGKYDVLGVEDGGARIILDMDTLRYFHAPDLH